MPLEQNNSLAFGQDPRLQQVEEEVGHLAIDLSAEAPAAFDRAASVCPWLEEASPSDFFDLKPYHQDARHIVAREFGAVDWKTYRRAMMLQSWREGRLPWPLLVLHCPRECREIALSSQAAEPAPERSFWSGSPSGARRDAAPSAWLEALIRGQEEESPAFLSSLASLASSLGIDDEGRPIEAALCRGFEEAALVLMREGWLPGVEAFDHALEARQSRAAGAMLDLGVKGGAASAVLAAREKSPHLLRIIQEGAWEGPAVVEGTPLLASLATEGCSEEVFAAALDRGLEDLDGSAWRRCVALDRKGLRRVLEARLPSPQIRSQDRFLAACTLGDEAEARRLSQEGAVQALSKFDRQILCFWARENSVEALRIALACGCPPSWTGPLQATPLHFAAWRSHPEAVELLISWGAPVNRLDLKRHSTPAGWLFRSARLLDTPLSPRLDAGRCGHFACLQMLLDAGAVILPSYIEAAPDWLNLLAFLIRP